MSDGEGESLTMSDGEGGSASGRQRKSGASKPGNEESGKQGGAARRKIQSETFSAEEIKRVETHEASKDAVKNARYLNRAMKKIDNKQTGNADDSEPEDDDKGYSSEEEKIYARTLVLERVDERKAAHNAAKARANAEAERHKAAQEEARTEQLRLKLELRKLEGPPKAAAQEPVHVVATPVEALSVPEQQQEQESAEILPMPAIPIDQPQGASAGNRKETDKPSANKRKAPDGAPAQKHRRRNANGASATDPKKLSAYMLWANLEHVLEKYQGMTVPVAAKAKSVEWWALGPNEAKPAKPEDANAKAKALQALAKRAKQIYADSNGSMDTEAAWKQANTEAEAASKKSVTWKPPKVLNSAAATNPNQRALIANPSDDARAAAAAADDSQVMAGAAGAAAGSRSGGAGAAGGARHDAPVVVKEEKLCEADVLQFAKNCFAKYRKDTGAATAMFWGCVGHCAATTEKQKATNKALTEQWKPVLDKYMQENNIAAPEVVNLDSDDDDELNFFNP